LGVSSLRDLEPDCCASLLAKLQKEEVFTGLLLDGGLVITTRSAVPSKEAAAGLHLLAFSAPVLRKNKRGAHATAQLICAPKPLSPERAFGTNEALGVTIVACEHLSCGEEHASVACNVSSLSRSLGIGSNAVLLVYYFTALRLPRGNASKISSESMPPTALSWNLKKGRIMEPHDSEVASNPVETRKIGIQFSRSRSFLSSKNDKSGGQRDLVVPSCVLFNNDGEVSSIVDHDALSKAQAHATPMSAILEWILSMYDMTGTSIRLPPIGFPNENVTSEHILPEAAVEERLTESVPVTSYDATPEAASDSVPCSLNTSVEQRVEDSVEGDSSAPDAVNASSPTDQVNETNVTASSDTGLGAANSTGDDVECHPVEVTSTNQMAADDVESAHVDIIAPMQSAEKQKLTHDELKARIMGYGNTSGLMKRQSARADVSRHAELANIAAGVQILSGGPKETTSNSSSAKGRGSEGGFIGETGSTSRKPALWRFGSTGQHAAAATAASDGAGHEGVSQNSALKNLSSLQMIVAAPVAAFVELGSKMSGAMVDLGGAFRRNQENDDHMAEMSELDRKKLQEQEVRRQDAYKNAAASLFKTSHHQERLSTPDPQALPPDMEHPENGSCLDQVADVEVDDAKGLESQASAEDGCSVLFGAKQGDEKDGDGSSKRNGAAEVSGDGVSEGRRPCELDGGAYACDHSTALSGSLSMELSKELKGEHSSEIVVGARSSDGSSKSSEQSSHSHARDSTGSSSSTDHVKEKWPLATQTSAGGSTSMGTRRPRVILDDHWWKTKLVSEEPGRRLVAAQLAREAMLMRGGSGNVSRLEGRIGGLEAPTPLASRSNSGVPPTIRKGAITTALHDKGTDVAQGSNAEGSEPEGEGEDKSDGADGASQRLAEKRGTDPPGGAADGASACMDKPLDDVGGSDGIGLHGAQGNHLVGKGSAATMLGKVEVTLSSSPTQAEVQALQQPSQTATANQDPWASKAEHKTPVKAVPPPVDKRLQSGFDGLMQAIESLATMSVSRSPGAKPWASSNRGTDKGVKSQNTQSSSPVLAYDGAVTSQGKRQTEPSQAAAGATRQPAMFPNTPGASTGHRLPAASPEHTQEYAHRAGVLSLQQQAAWLWDSAQHMAARGTRASSASSDGDSQARGSGIERDRPHPFPPVQLRSASPGRSHRPSSRLVVCASSRRGGSRPAPRGFSAREAMRGGVDSEGRQYASADEMWRQETGERAVSAGEGGSGEGAMEAEMGGKKREWYDKGVKYWEGVEASVDGVLGGYGSVSATDAAGSAAFLQEVYGAQLDAARSQGRPLVALDCGAGIGRVTKEFLLHVFNEVDLVEPVRHFIDAARHHLTSPPSSAASPAASHRAVNFFCCPLQVLPAPGAARSRCCTLQVLPAPGAARSRCCPLQVLPSQVLPSQVLPFQSKPAFLRVT
ncbi:unnamed protein product, partial [Closterium sp. Yama58-4]